MACWVSQWNFCWQRALLIFFPPGRWWISILQPPLRVHSGAGNKTSSLLGKPLAPGQEGQFALSKGQPCWQSCMPAKSWLLFKVWGPYFIIGAHFLFAWIEKGCKSQVNGHTGNHFSLFFLDQIFQKMPQIPLSKSVLELVIFQLLAQISNAIPFNQVLFSRHTLVFSSIELTKWSS